MPAGNSIIGDCAECCTCPTATVEWDSRSASLTKQGFVSFTYNDPPTISPSLGGPPQTLGTNLRRFLRSDWDGSDGFNVYSGFNTVDALTGSVTCGASRTNSGIVIPECGAGPTNYNISLTLSQCGLAGSSCETVTITLSEENTNALLKTNTVAALPAYDNDWNDTAGSFANLSTDELTYSIRESRYRLRFKIPPTSVYRLTWVERFIGEAGTTIASVEVISRGVYRPIVTLSAPPTGGTQARAIAVMSSTGTISSIIITNPGSGYTSAPTVTIQAAINGGTSSTGWTATLTDGKVTAISGGSAGDYRPTLTFSAPGGTGTTAAATCTVDETGGIDAVSVTAAGSGYTAEPTLTISSKVSGTTAAVLHLHLGTETSKCIAWDGTTPSGYDPATSSTYPILPSSGYYEMAVPTSDGTTLVANVRAYCDNSSCP